MRSIYRSALAALLLVVSNTENAFSEDAHDAAKTLKESGEILPLETIVEKARRQVPGRILEVELKKKERLIYELELLDENGVVWELYYDAKTGELIRKKPDD